ncbi:glycosyltransferase [Thiocapsa bogorovii]|uniref:glycosyltransferase n=1 Tax=Thiocapsa bogorovii TaxID=521689 RepID=UPI001E4B1841|nr:glycosyltransferase [Thiocapsa bogorovii]UHD14541.1 hypothetical protein LT988_14655 [Thiocapsa bogorovii]
MTPTQSPSTPRILLYAHAQLGVGHVQRSLLIAAALMEQQGAACMLLACRKGLDGLDLPSDLHIATLPDWPAADDRGGPARVRERADRIAEAFRVFLPHAVLVDHLFLGLGGELAPVLASTPRNPDAPLFAIGVPYGPRPTMRGPRNPGVRRAIGRYDLALCYVDARHERPAEAFERQGYLLPEERHDVGYVVEPAFVPAPPGSPPLVVGLAGGGSTGVGLFRLLESALRTRLDRGEIRLRIVAGPLGDPSASCIDASRIQVLTRSPLRQALDGASLVVSRCGYNTAYALLRISLPIVFCPYAGTGSDQIDRAAALGRLEGVWTFDEQAGAASLAARIDEGLGVRPTGRAESLDCDGAERAAHVLASLAKRRITL